MVSENRYTFFSMNLEVPEMLINSDQTTKKLDDAIDMILYSMNACSKETHKVYKFDNSRITVIFKSLTRKRKGQLNKFCERYLDKEITFTTEAIDKYEVMGTLKVLKDNPVYSVKNEAELYNGRDIEIFHDKKNWHPWQKDLYDMIYDESRNIKTPDLRNIISLIDYAGNSGKSSFFKYLYVNDNENNIGRSSYGSASQLRSSIINQGVKKVYIIDLSRSKSKADREEDLLSAIEDCKSGLVISSMYGKYQELLMEPPHVIICSNYLFKTEGLSADRWNIYEIKDKKLGTKNALLKLLKKKPELLKK